MNSASQLRHILEENSVGEPAASGFTRSSGPASPCLGMRSLPGGPAAVLVALRGHGRAARAALPPPPNPEVLAPAAGAAPAEAAPGWIPQHARTDPAQHASVEQKRQMV